MGSEEALHPSHIHGELVSTLELDVQSAAPRATTPLEPFPSSEAADADDSAAGSSGCSCLGKVLRCAVWRDESHELRVQLARVTEERREAQALLQQRGFALWTKDSL